MYEAVSCPPIEASSVEEVREVDGALGTGGEGGGLSGGDGGNGGGGSGGGSEGGIVWEEEVGMLPVAEGCRNLRVE